MDLTNSPVDASGISQEILRTLNTFRNEFKNEISDLKKLNNRFNKKAKELEDKITTVDLNQKKTDEEVNILKSRVDIFQQKELKNDILITGLPVITGQQLNETVLVYLKVLDSGINETHVDFVFRFNSPLSSSTNTNESNISPVVVRFQNYCTKKSLIDKQKTTGPVMQSQLTNDNNNTRKIILQQRLTPMNFQLLQKAREHKIKAGYKFVWVSESLSIFMQKDEKSKSIKIVSASQLEQLFPTVKEPSAGTSSQSK